MARGTSRVKRPLNGNVVLLPDLTERGQMLAVCFENPTILFSYSPLSALPVKTTRGLHDNSAPAPPLFWTGWQYVWRARSDERARLGWTGSGEDSRVLFRVPYFTANHPRTSEFKPWAVKRKRKFSDGFRRKRMHGLVRLYLIVRIFEKTQIF